MDGKKSEEKEVVKDRLYLSLGPSGRGSRGGIRSTCDGRGGGHQNTNSKKMAAWELL